MKLKAQFHRKQSEFATSLAEVEKVIELPRDEFRAFLRSPLDDYPFITENKDRMKMDQDGVYHCLLVVGESHDDGILIEAEGYDYARYSAYVPGARQFVEQTIRPMCLKKLENSLTDAVDEVTSCAHAYEGESPYRVLISDLKETHGFEEAYVPLFIEMLNEREHLGSLEFEVIGDELFVYNDQQEETQSNQHSGFASLSFPPERMERLLDNALEWIGNQETGGALYNTLSEQLGMTDEEIAEAGFALDEHFNSPDEEESSGMTMQ